jgi:hypothetical protein
MSSSRFRSLPIGISVALALALPVAAYAATNTAAVASGASNGATLALSAKTKKSLAREHVTLTAKRPATSKKKTSFALPDSSGKWNFTNGTGTLNFKGVLHHALKKHSLNVKYVTLNRPAKGNGSVVANVAGHKKVKLFTITGKAHIKQSGVTETISGLTAKLTKAGANRINTALHSKAVKNGQSLGSFTVVVSTSPVTTGTTATAPAGAAGAPGVSGAGSSGVGLDLTPDFRSLLGSVGLSTLPIVPASNGLPAPLGTTSIPGADGTSVSLPLAGGSAGASFDQGTLTGTIPLSGGLQLDNGQVQASLTNPTLTLGTGTEGSSLGFSLNGGPELKLFDIDTSQLESSLTPDGELDLQGLLATLSQEGAATLNQLLGQDVFTTGQPVGGLSVILPAAASSAG